MICRPELVASLRPGFGPAPELHFGDQLTSAMEHHARVDWASLPQPFRRAARLVGATAYSVVHYFETRSFPGCVSLPRGAVRCPRTPRRTPTCHSKPAELRDNPINFASQTTSSFPAHV